jgi:hypothetical protein
MDLSNSGVQFGGTGARVTTILDEDDMASDSATSLATQQSIKKYVDDNAGGGGMDNWVLTGDSGTDQTVDDGETVDIKGGTYITTTVGATNKITINHSDTSTLSGVYGNTANGTKIDQITVDGRGHVTAVSTGNTGTVSSVATGTGLTGGTITSTGTITFQPGGTSNGIITSNGTTGHTVEANITAYKNSSNEGILQIRNTSLLNNPFYNIKASGQHYLDIKPATTSTGTHDGMGLMVYGEIRITDPGNAATVSTNAGRGHLLAQGDVVAYISSDKRLKDNIIPIKSPLKKLLKIGGYNFEWNDKGPDWVKDEYFGNPSGSLKDVGVIAQEIQPILPEAVKQRKDGYLSVKYEKIVPLLIEAVKEQQTQIEELKTQINQLNK